MSYITPVGEAPDFTKKQAKSDTHKYVSKTWWDKCLTFDQVMDNVETGLRNREDIQDHLSSMTTVVEDGQFKFKYKDGRTFVPTDHCLEQLGVYTGVSTFFLKDMRQDKKDWNRDDVDATVLKLVVDNALRRMESSSIRKWRTYNDGTMRAWLSEKYAEIDNRWYLELLNEIIPDGRYSHWKGDEDTIYGNILVPDSIIEKDDLDSEYGGMVSIGNSEIGERRISSQPSVFRAICMNGCIWGQNKGNALSQVHRGKINLITLRKSVIDNVTKQIKLSHDGIDKLLNTRMFTSTEVAIGNIIMSVIDSIKATKEEAKLIVNEYQSHESHNENLFGIINGITRASQKVKPERWIFLDSAAGEMLNWNQDRWNLQVNRGKNITAEDVKRIMV